MALIKSSIGTKFVSTWSDLMCKLALDAVRCVAIEEDGTGKTEVDIKRYARVEKVGYKMSYAKKKGDTFYVILKVLYY